MAKINGTASSERFNLTGSYVLIGDSWVLTSPAGTTNSRDVVSAGAGNDEVEGGGGADQILGQAGYDLLIGNAGDDAIDGGDDNDVVYGGSAIPGSIGSGKDDLHGGNGDDTIYSGDGNDGLAGDAGSDTLYGEAGIDKLNGGDGDDRLIGGAGADALDGGTGADLYVFNAVADSLASAGHGFTKTTGDVINSFVSAADTADPLQQDKIDLRGLVSGIDQSLTWSDTAATAYGVWYSASRNATLVSIDTSGDGLADMVVKIGAEETLSGDDFLGLADTTAPEAPTIDLDAASDTGTSDSDDVTSIKSLGLSGTAEANATIKVYDGAILFTTLNANGLGDWSYTTGSLDEGEYHFTATATDAVGNESVSSDSLRVTIDSVPPDAPTIDLNTASDSGPFNDDDITSDDTLSLSGTAEADATITLYDGAILLTTLIADGLGDWSYTTGSLVDGAHDFTATATDAAGNESDGFAILSVTIDTTNPDVPTIDLDAASDTGRLNNDNVTSDATPSLSGTADPDATIKLYDGALLLTTLIADEFGDWSFTTDSLAEGPHSLTAKAIDDAGNESTASLVLTVTIDTTAPNAAPSLDLTTASDTGVSPFDNVTADATPMLGGGAENNATIEVYDGAVLVGSATAGNQGAWTFTTDALTDGDHVFTAKSVDAAGNTGPASMPLTVTIDTIPPSSPPAITGWNDDTGDVGDGVTSDTTLVITGAAGANLTVRLYDGAALLGAAAANAAGDWSFATPILGLGDHSFTAVAVDDAGNPSSSSTELLVTIEAPPSPPVSVIELATLTLPQGIVLQGDAENDRLGWSVSEAGDVNGDGFGDFIVGATGLGDIIVDGMVIGSRGGAYVVFGGASPVNIDMRFLTPAEGFVLQGDLSGVGFDVSGAGDVNGDGFDDLIIGASTLSSPDDVHVVFGSAAPVNVDLDALAPGQGITIFETPGQGRSVSGAGDFNGDGFADLIIGAIGGAGGLGAAYVIFGGADLTDIDPENLGAERGFRIDAPVSGTFNLRLGYSLSFAGDVNGDGFDDVIIGGPYGKLPDDVYGTGAVYVILGGANSGTINTAALDPSQGFLIRGDNAYDKAGWSVAGAGDVNGDGFDDMIIGAPYGDGAGQLGQSGEAYVVFGSANPVEVDITSLADDAGFIIKGEDSFDLTGRRVSGAGDVNGDGYADVIVGAPEGSFQPSEAGEAYLVFGGPNLVDIYLPNMAPEQGITIRGAMPRDFAGWAVSGAGDVNGDGFDDLVVGAQSADVGGNYAGQTYVLFGGAFGLGSTPVITSGTTEAEILIGGLGDDSLTGGGGADILRGGAGNDVLAVTGTDFADVDGGEGLDVLRLDGAGDSFDFSVIPSPEVTSIEAIDLTGIGDNSLALSALDLFNLSDDTFGGITHLTVYGNVGDSVSTLDSGWANIGTTDINGDTFNVFEKGQAQLIVDAHINIAGIMDL